MKHLFIELEIREGEREHTHRVLHTTRCKDLDFAAQHYAAHYWGESFRYQRTDKHWYAHGGEIAIRVYRWKELTAEEFKVIRELFYA